MVIYQIHEYGGEWEDRFDYIVFSCLSKDRAVEEKERLIKQEESRERCSSCPLYFCPNECSGKHCGLEECTTYRIEAAKKYCSDYTKDSNCEDKCANYRYHFETSFFRIEEVEVVE